MSKDIQLIPFDLNEQAHINCLYTVRTHPEVAAHFFAPPPSSFLQHINFLTKVTQFKERSFLIVSFEDQLCGYCQIINRAEELEVGFALHPLWWNKGIGAISIKLLLEYIHQKSTNKAQRIKLIVKNDNSKALHLYEKYGFVKTSELNQQITMKYLPQNGF